MGSSSHLWFCACKTSPLGPELQVSVGPRPHLWFLHAKQQILDQNIKSLWVKILICGFRLRNSVFWYRIISLYGPQTSLVILCMPTIVISPRITSRYGSLTSPVVLCMQNSVPSIRITSLYGSQPSSVAVAC